MRETKVSIKKTSHVIQTLKEFIIEEKISKGDES